MLMDDWQILHTDALGDFSLLIHCGWFDLVYLFIHSVTHATLDMSITDYNLYITTQLIIYGHPSNII